MARQRLSARSLVQRNAISLLVRLQTFYTFCLKEYISISHACAETQDLHASLAQWNLLSEDTRAAIKRVEGVHSCMENILDKLTFGERPSGECDICMWDRQTSGTTPSGGSDRNMQYALISSETPSGQCDRKIFGEQSSSEMPAGECDLCM